MDTKAKVIANNWVQRDREIIRHPYTQERTAAPPLPIVKGEGILLPVKRATLILTPSLAGGAISTVMRIPKIKNGVALDTGLNGTWHTPKRGH